MMFAQVQAASVDTVKAAIVKHSIEMGVDPAITLSIAKTESGYRHEARSPHGAVGVFQLMPSTARRMGLNPYSLDDNVKGGVMYYKSMYQMFGSMQLAVAAYNAGPVMVKRYNAVPPFAETKRFVSKIMSDYYYLKAHTDPVVTAYYNNKKAEEQKKLAQLKKEEELKKQAEQEKNVSVIQQNEPVKGVSVAKVETSDSVVAKAPIKAPVPSSKKGSKLKTQTNVVSVEM